MLPTNWKEWCIILSMNTKESFAKQYSTAKIYVHPIAEASARAAEYFDDLFDRQDEE